MSDECRECGFVYREDEGPVAAPDIVEGADRLATVIEAWPGDVARRVSSGVWSALEYGCHVRDVLLVQRERVLLARRTPSGGPPPSLAPMGRDERAEHDGYRDQDQAAVARQLRDAASMFANVLDRLDPLDWERTLLYNFPAPQERTLDWVAVHTLHEVRHHLLDVSRQMPDQASSGASPKRSE